MNELLSALTVLGCVQLALCCLLDSCFLDIEALEPLLSQLQLTLKMLPPQHKIIRNGPSDLADQPQL